jgi:ribosomal protein S18 acetylase RimI-like enzyme
LIAIQSALQAADVTQAALLHRRAFPRFFLTSLGEPFLVEFYRGFLGDASAVTVAAHDERGQLRGVAVGSVEPAGFFRRLLLRRWPGFLLASVRAVLASPWVTPRLLHALGYRGNAAPGEHGALLSSICVDPNLQGHGIGRELLTAWTTEAALRGANRAFLTTDADNNASTLRFYESCGWSPTASFETAQGRRMQRYGITLDALAGAIAELLDLEPDLDVVGARQGEKVYETLATREQMRRADDRGDYFRIAVDARGPYFEGGDVAPAQLNDYHLHNTERLCLGQIEERLATPPEFRVLALHNGARR